MLQGEEGRPTVLHVTAERNKGDRGMEERLAEGQGYGYENGER